MAGKSVWRVKSSDVASLVILQLLLSSATAFSQRLVPPYRITAVKAMLFYGQSGTFSTDVFGANGPTLQNVTTGEGQSRATLVVVESTGQPDSYAPTRKIALTATERGRLLLSRTVPLGRTGADGKFYAAFWLYDTGCTPVMLEARLVGQPEKSAVQKTINFKCGD